MLIADLPRTERPRERLSALGPTALADRELLSMLLGTGGPGTGAHALAERLLATFGSIPALARAHPTDLTALPGIGWAKAATLVSAFELARRAGCVEARRQVTSTLDLVDLAAPLLRGRTRERLVVVICDTANRVLHCEVVSEGSAERSLVPVREVIVSVLRRDGQAFALAHNHPAGDPTPSPADREATDRIEQAAGAVGLRFLDHVVLTDAGWARVCD
ncbi:DNA repair protein RadC [Rugosimonospora acidiphila]|uniref:DNA repair protein RadC n=1 Tax=Rugosimonospora acidiphila TaxID=556531 RepID=A0ABP9RS21_9ACTN